MTQPPRTTDEPRADELRAAMVDRIADLHERLGLVLDDDVRRALRTVPRHLFAGADADLEAAYQDQSAIVTKRNERGMPISSLSAPWLQALMIGQAAVRPGSHVLEIGSGGYHAALLREVVGDAGQVVSVDIDPEVTDRATRVLSAAGYRDIEVITADAEYPLTPARAFDAIIVTVGAWDIPPAWSAQLAPGGRLVVPLRTYGLTRSWALERRGPALVSVDQLMCGFVAMQGAGAYRGPVALLLPDDLVALSRDEDAAEDVAGPIDAGDLAGVLGLPSVEARTGVAIGAETSFADLDLWLATTMPGACLMTARQQAIDDGTVALPWPHGSPAAIDGRTVAYRARPRPGDGPGDPAEFAVVAHGPDDTALAEAMVARIEAWQSAGRPSPQLTVLPAATPDADLPPGNVLDKRHTRLVISWHPTA